MSKLSKAVRREIDAQTEALRGTMISEMEMRRTDDSDPSPGTGAWGWCGDVEVGENRFLRNVTIRPVNGRMSYAKRGLPVVLTKNHAGQYEVTGPGDTVIDTMEIIYYDLDGTETGTGTLGYTFERKGFDWYKGPTPGTPGTSYWGSSNYHFGYVRIVDGDGNPVT